MGIFDILENNITDQNELDIKTWVSVNKHKGNFILISSNSTPDTSDVKWVEGNLYPVEDIERINFNKAKYVAICIISKVLVLADVTTKDIHIMLTRIYNSTGDEQYSIANQDTIIQNAKNKSNQFLPQLYKDLYQLLPDKYKPSAIVDKGTVKLVDNNDFKIIDDFTLTKNRRISKEENSEITRKLAEYIATGLGSTLSDDREVTMFTESIFWTLDGIEIRITQLYSPVKPNQIESNGIYYVIQCDTPNGNLVYNTNPDESFEHTKIEIGKRFKSLNRPSVNWVPKSRDLYLTGNRFTQKILDADKNKFIDTIEKFYPKMRLFARRNNTILPQLTALTKTDMIAVFYIMENFLLVQPEPLVALKRMSDMDETFDIQKLMGINNISTNIVDLKFVMSMSITYSIARKLAPNRTGWHIFNYVGNL